MSGLFLWPCLHWSPGLAYMWYKDSLILILSYINPDFPILLMRHFSVGFCLLIEHITVGLFLLVPLHLKCGKCPFVSVKSVQLKL